MDALHPMTSLTFGHAHWFQMSQAPPPACVWNDHHETIDEVFAASASCRPQYHLHDDPLEITNYGRPPLYSNLDTTTPVLIGNHPTESITESNRLGLQHGTSAMDGQDIHSDINYLGPPIPPPPPSDSSPSKIDTEASGEVSINGPHRTKYHVENRHENLRDARDDLIGHRFRLRAKRDELRTARENAGIRAGTAFSSVQKFLSQKDIHIPDDIAQEFSNAAALRDQLGQIDAEYDEKEQDYNFLEWAYTKTERAFVEDFANTPHTSDQTEAAGVNEIREERILEPQELTRNSFTHALPDLIDDTVDMDGSEISDDGAKLPRLSRNRSTRDAMTMVRLLSGLRKAHYPFGHIITADNFSAISKADGDDSAGQIYHRVESWMMETLLGSFHQQSRLRAELDDKYMDDVTWWKLSMRYWATKRPSTFVLHPGDSTGSNEDVMLTESRLAAQSTMNPSASVYRESAVRSHDMNMLLGYYFNDETKHNFPAAIEPIDLGGAVIELETPLITVQDVEQSQDCPVLGARQVARFNEPVEDPEIDIPGETPTPQRLDEVFATSVNNGTAIIPTSVLPYEEFTAVNRDLQSLPVPPSFVSPGSNGLQTCPHSPVSNPEQRAVLDDSRDTRLSVATTRPLSPPNTRSPSPEAWTKCPFLPFLRDGITPKWSRIFHLPRVPICSCIECDQSRESGLRVADTLNSLH